MRFRRDWITAPRDSLRRPAFGGRSYGGALVRPWFRVAIAASIFATMALAAPEAFAAKAKKKGGSGDDDDKPATVVKIPVAPPASCDFGFVLDDFYQALKEKVCLGDYTSFDKDCYEFKPSQVLQNAVWMFGGGVGRLGVVGAVTSAGVLVASGFSEVDSYGGTKDSERAVKLNTLREVHDIACPANRKFMTTARETKDVGDITATETDLQNWLGGNPVDVSDSEENLRFEYEIQDGNPATRIAKPPPTLKAAEKKTGKALIEAVIARLADEKRRTGRDRDVEDIKREIEQAKWCEPTPMVVSRRVFDFLRLPRKERAQKLCADKDLRDYYAKLTHSFRKRQKDALAISGLKCADGGSGFTYTVRDKTSDKRMTIDVKNGTPGSFTAAWNDRNQTEAGQAWDGKLRELRPELDRTGGKAPEVYEYHLATGADGSRKVASAEYTKHVGAIFDRVRMTDEQLDVIGTRLPDQNAKSLREGLRMYEVFAGDAKNCCSQAGAAERTQCLGRLDADKLSGAAAAPVVPGAANSRPRR